MRKMRFYLFQTSRAGLETEQSKDTNDEVWTPGETSESDKTRRGQETGECDEQSGGHDTHSL